jgi:hypothetical protein
MHIKEAYTEIVTSVQESSLMDGFIGRDKN